MLKVFLVEDEAIIREGLRDIIPWQQYGYTLVGDAGDGEQALPMIRETHPDVLITDIKMPFMDGLALSNLVHKEFPNTKIIIISGYDDFEYARQAITVGACQYLLKPITKTMLIKTLNEVQEKIAAEQEQENYLDKFRTEMQEYEQFSRRRFFESLVTGQLNAQTIYEKADELHIALHAQCYNIILCGVNTKKQASVWQNTQGTEVITQINDILESYFGLSNDYLIFQWNITTHAILIKSDRDMMKQLTEHCIQSVQRLLQPFEHEIEWYVAYGNETERLSQMGHCFREASHIFSYRHLMQGTHILTADNTRRLRDTNDSSLLNLDFSKIDPAVIRGFLQNGIQEEVEDFVKEYVYSLHEAVDSNLFCQYLVLNVRFISAAYLETLGYNKDEIQAEFPAVLSSSTSIAITELEMYIIELLECALSLREQKEKTQGDTLVAQAAEYVRTNFALDTISLKEVAAVFDVSVNYLSAVFSQEMEQTFVEYLTECRMQKAKALLKDTNMKTAQIAAEVGYKDPHYFSFVFRKTQGCTPRDFRTGEKHAETK